jgi:hypothetical protein
MKITAANRNVAEVMVKDLCEAARNLRNAAIAALALKTEIGTAAQKTHDSIWMQSLKIQMRAEQIDAAVKRFDAAVKAACDDAARYAGAK